MLGEKESKMTMDNQEAISKLKEKYPQYKDIHFNIRKGIIEVPNGLIGEVDNGTIRYTTQNVIVDNIQELQEFINKCLNQVPYRVQYTGYIDVCASSEEEAMEFTRYDKPINTIRIIREL